MILIVIVSGRRKTGFDIYLDFVAVREIGPVDLFGCAQIGGQDINGIGATAIFGIHVDGAIQAFLLKRFSFGCSQKVKAKEDVGDGEGKRQYKVNINEPVFPEGYSL